VYDPEHHEDYIHYLNPKTETYLGYGSVFDSTANKVFLYHANAEKVDVFGKGLYGKGAPKIEVGEFEDGGMFAKTDNAQHWEIRPGGNVLLNSTVSDPK